MDYTIADIRIRIADALLRGHFAQALAPFALPEPGTAESYPDSGCGQTAAFAVQAGICGAAGPEYTEICSFGLPDADADAMCRLGRDASGYLLEMQPRGAGRAAHLHIRGAEVVTDIAPDHPATMLRFGIWLAYNIIAAPRGAVSLHASAINSHGQAVLFLGESGTGKSTHTRLWREHIPGTELLNDDSPILATDEGIVRASGSPWSGKTPCYRNAAYPLRALVRLSQAPRNQIRRLSPIEAIGALLPSAPPALAHDRGLQDAVCALLSSILERVPVYHLACRPDGQAARLAFETIFGKE